LSEKRDVMNLQRVFTVATVVPSLAAADDGANWQIRFQVQLLFPK